MVPGNSKVDDQWMCSGQLEVRKDNPGLFWFEWNQKTEQAGQNRKCSGKTSTLGKTLGGVGLGPSHLKMVNTLCCWGPPSRLVQ